MLNNLTIIFKCVHKLIQLNWQSFTIALMIFFAEVKLCTFLISSGTTFQSLVDEPLKLFLQFEEEPNSITFPLVTFLVPIPSFVSDFCSTLSGY
jgi:hypothetical protein